MNKRKIIIIFSIFLILIWATTFFLVIPPIGAIPEGKTVWLFKPDRLFVEGKIDFIESLDHFQYNNIGKVTLLGRGFTLMAILNSSKIILRLPYSESLELMANNGEKWE